MANRTQRISAEQQDRMVALYAQGLSRAQIVEQTNSSWETVNAILHRRGVELRPWRERKLSGAAAEDLVKRYRAGEGMTALAADYGVTPLAVRKLFDRLGIERRDDRGRKRVFTDAEMATIRTMAAEGSSQYQIAQALGSAKITVQKVMFRSGIPPAREGSPRGAAHPSWKGGRLKHPSGYWQVRLEQSDPMFVMANRSGCVMEHRLVMARSISRPLEAQESVHHINGDRMDNRLENLQLRSSQHGSGVCFQCADCGSTNVVAVEIAHAEESN